MVAVVALEFLLGFAGARMLDTVERGKDVYDLILLVPLFMKWVMVRLTEPP